MLFVTRVQRTAEDWQSVVNFAWLFHFIPGSPIGRPQLSQNLASGSFSSLQAGQAFVLPSEVPHPLQNLALASLAWLHL